MFIFITRILCLCVVIIITMQTANTSATTTTAPAVNEELVTKEPNTETSEATLVKSLHGMPTRVKEPVGSRTKRATATVTATTTTAVKEEGLSSVDVKPSEATGIKKEHVNERKEANIPSDKAACIEGKNSQFLCIYSFTHTEGTRSKFQE